eukprot:161002-Rhodomonas_salina.1
MPSGPEDTVKLLALVLQVCCQRLLAGWLLLFALWSVIFRCLFALVDVSFSVGDQPTYKSGDHPCVHLRDRASLALLCVRPWLVLAITNSGFAMPLRDCSCIMYPCDLGLTRAFCAVRCRQHNLPPWCHRCRCS